ncbi:MAG: cytochrome o ubiquinol oxidase subunit III [Gammaproteobacteria bacterium]|nr:cytochrome o ubiquinol oxidase subunit III [Gammaproteobacteria bacterium]MCH9743810.1 cytochrome o ubiquinol oxidase subunit III [Gammaproteobacteria bacterium]
MTNTSTELHDHHHDADATDVFGFWLYILTDCVLFATLFATYAVMHNNTFGGPGIGQLASLPYVFAETMFLLGSSFTYGLAILGMYRNKKKAVLNWLIVTFILGIGFIAMEINEFVHLYREGHSWHASGALTAFFTLVGTHGLHVSMGLLWMAIMIIQVARYGTTGAINRRLTYLGLFWHFLDIVWIFVFTIVYLMGAI